MDVRSILARPLFFRWFNILIGGRQVREICAREFIRARDGDLILDIGCGMADILEYLPQVQYQGFDMSEDYIHAARERFRDRAQFTCESLNRRLAEHSPSVDVVLALGLLHHLNDDEVLDVLTLARRCLKNEGRLVTMDGCYREGQSWGARFFLSHDRGQYVRQEQDYIQLARKIFLNVRAVRHEHLLRFPYTHLFMECS